MFLQDDLEFLEEKLKLYNNWKFLCLSFIDWRRNLIQVKSSGNDLKTFQQLNQWHSNRVTNNMSTWLKSCSWILLVTLKTHFRVTLFMKDCVFAKSLSTIFKEKRKHFSLSPLFSHGSNGREEIFHINLEKNWNLVTIVSIQQKQAIAIISSVWRVKS